MMIKRKITSFVLLLFGVTFAQAQLSNGYKYGEQGMYHVMLNIPFSNASPFYSSPFYFYSGLDFTTKNRKVPSGLAPQVGLAYKIVENEDSATLVSANLNAGYLFDFNKKFDNQFRVSPHLYCELVGNIQIRAGYEYMMPFRKGYPFFSIGIGPGIMFPHLVKPIGF